MPSDDEESFQRKERRRLDRDTARLDPVILGEPPGIGPGRSSLSDNGQLAARRSAAAPCLVELTCHSLSEWQTCLSALDAQAQVASRGAFPYMSAQVRHAIEVSSKIFPTLCPAVCALAVCQELWVTLSF